MVHLLSEFAFSIHLGDIGGDVLKAVLTVAATIATDRTVSYLAIGRELRRNLRGSWVSWWQTKAVGAEYPQEVHERVHVRISWWRRKVVITNRGSAGSASVFEAYGVVKDERFVGYYVSEKGDDGVSILTISPNRDFMYGYWMGESFDQSRAMGEMVFGKSEAKLKMGIDELRRMS